MKVETTWILWLNKGVKYNLLEPTHWEMCPNGGVKLSMDLPYASGWSYVWTQYILSHFLVLTTEETYSIRAVPSENYSKVLYDKVSPGFPQLTTFRAQQPRWSYVVTYFITWRKHCFLTDIASDFDSLSRNWVLANVASSSTPTGPCISVYYCLHESLNSFLKCLLSLFLFHYNEQPVSKQHFQKCKYEHAISPLKAPILPRCP